MTDTPNSHRAERITAETSQALAIHEFNSNLHFPGDEAARRKGETAFFATLGAQLGVRMGRMAPDIILLEPPRISAIHQKNFVVFRSELNPHRGVAVAMMEHNDAFDSVGILFLGLEEPRSFTLHMTPDEQTLAELIINYFVTKELDVKALTGYEEILPTRSDDGKLPTGRTVLDAVNRMNAADRAPSGLSPAVVKGRTRITDVDVAFITLLAGALEKLRETGKESVDFSLSLENDVVVAHFQDPNVKDAKELAVSFKVINYPANPSWVLKVPAAQCDEQVTWDIPFPNLNNNLPRLAEHVAEELSKLDPAYTGVRESYEIGEHGLAFTRRYATGRAHTTVLKYPGSISQVELQEFEQKATPSAFLAYVSKALSQLGDEASPGDIFTHIYGNTIMSN